MGGVPDVLSAVAQLADNVEGGAEGPEQLRWQPRLVVEAPESQGAAVADELHRVAHGDARAHGHAGLEEGQVAQAQRPHQQGWRELALAVEANGKRLDVEGAGRRGGAVEPGALARLVHELRRDLRRQSVLLD